MKKRYTTYETLCKLPLGGSLWGLLFFFIFTACQDEIPNDTTEVMMTFTTRAVVTQNNESDVIDIEKMNDIHVIVARQDGTVVYDGKPSVNTSNGTASVSFNTPVMTGGEDFKFFAIANESSLVNPPQNYTDINGLISHVVGDGNAIVIDKSIPQTKYWIHPVKQLLGETQYIKKTLDYLASKISVQFINNTNKTQSLSNIYITGITPNGKGRLFNQPTGEKDANGEDIYEEVYVDSDVTLDNNKITFGDVTNLSVGASSVIQHFYTYPVDADNMSSPTLYATWNETQYDLPIEINDEFITALNRNDHLKIIVTLTGQELTVNYTIAPWEEHATNIGSPTTDGGYDVKDWDDGNDVVIGEEDESGGGDDPVVSGDVIWEGTQEIDWGKQGGIHFTMEAEKFKVCYGKLIGFDFVITEGKSEHNGFAKVLDSGGEEKVYAVIPSTVQDGKITMEMDLSQYNLPEGCHLLISGDGITLKKVYIKTQ